MPGSQPTDASIWIFSFIFQCKPQLAIHWRKRNMKYIFKRNKKFCKRTKICDFYIDKWILNADQYFAFSLFVWFGFIPFSFRFILIFATLVKFFSLLIFFLIHHPKTVLLCCGIWSSTDIVRLLVPTALKKTVRFRFCEFLFFIKWKR